MSLHCQVQLSAIDIYGQWIGVVAEEQRSIVNGALRGVLLSLAIAIIGLFMDDWIGGLFDALLERSRVPSPYRHPPL